uniref:Uncharacterized protein n=1 Tax=Rangifer tarandus platyrhynchus TaxID=3082113 RepID=A0ACB0F4H3_RANTA|nr:unnamed protein product [Rangifer tarandus platyrhynchus]
MEGRTCPGGDGPAMLNMPLRPEDRRRLSGFQLPSSIVSSGSILTLWFTTDFAVSAQGFKALYEDDAALTGEGIVFTESTDSNAELLADTPSPRCPGVPFSQLLGVP